VLDFGLWVFAGHLHCVCKARSKNCVCLAFQLSYWEFLL
jgi:hypothetical protein